MKNVIKVTPCGRLTKGPHYKFKVGDYVKTAFAPYFRGRILARFDRNIYGGSFVVDLDEAFLSPVHTDQTGIHRAVYSGHVLKVINPETR